MSDWKAKRFWSEASAKPCDGGFTVELDGRPVKTPSKTLLVVPTQDLAQEIAAEWDAQKGEIDPLSMPFTRSSNAALDKVTHQHAEVADLLAAYGDADLICYRADSPDALIARQAQAWDPLLEWVTQTYRVQMEPVHGVMHRAQPPETLARLSQEVHDLDHFALTAFHDLVGMSGSLVIGLAALHNLHPAPILWGLSRVDEIWQEEQWGKDEEEQELVARKENDFLHAKRFYDLSRAP
ncbi:MAG: ATP12 family chaperone protein [Roseovarius sp.]